MPKTKIVTFKVKEDNIKKLFVKAFKETKNIGWLMELLLCYPENVETLKNLGLNINKIKSLTAVKRSETKSVNIELKRVKRNVTKTHQT